MHNFVVPSSVLACEDWLVTNKLLDLANGFKPVEETWADEKSTGIAEA